MANLLSTERSRLPDQQLVALQAPLVQLPQLTTPPLHVMQQRCLVLVELFWQYGVVQACARADGRSSSNAALLNRPNDLRMIIEPFAHQRHGECIRCFEYAGNPLSWVIAAAITAALCTVRTDSTVSEVMPDIGMLSIEFH